MLLGPQFAIFPLFHVLGIRRELKKKLHESELKQGRDEGLDYRIFNKMRCSPEGALHFRRVTSGISKAL